MIEPHLKILYVSPQNKPVGGFVINKIKGRYNDAKYKIQKGTEYKYVSEINTSWGIDLSKLYNMIFRISCFRSNTFSID